uniref:Histone deacetylase interacting domain-containing protein n=1 Tax=Setaria viridis TaxID=4556 RepID=A0A4V6D501_SETVI|nr:hypothetical protein SEVIR_6G017500v2 [Setaria viridis]
MGYTGGLKREREEEEEHQHGAPAPPVASRPRLDPPTPEPPVRVRPLAPARAEAARFLEVLLREFADKPDKVNEFRAVLLDYYYTSIDMSSVVGRMQIVLQGYPDLIRGFNTFLPRGYALKLDDQQGGGGAGDA